MSKTESPAAARVEPSLNEEAVDNIAPETEQQEAVKVEPTLVETVQPETKAASRLDTPVVAEEAEPEVAKTEENTTSAEQESKPETVEAAEPKAAEFSLNSNIEKAEISDFNDESSILDAHLHEQKLWMKNVRWLMLKRLFHCMFIHKAVLFQVKNSKGFTEIWPALW